LGFGFIFFISDEGLEAVNAVFGKSPVLCFVEAMLAPRLNTECEVPLANPSEEFIKVVY